MKRIAAVLASALLLAGAAQAQSGSSQGEVRRIDASAGKVTLKHGAIPGLQLPAMTLVFRVADPALLASIKAGDTVEFTAEKVDGQYTITAIRPR